MKRCPPHSSRAATIAATLLIALMAVGAYAQISTGNIYGHVQAKDGSMLPGVTVTLSGVGAPQSFVTDATGAFRFLSLSPGTYQVKAELAGYGTATRQGIGVSLGRNADVTMTLNPSVAESITVTAEAPVLDVRKTGTGATVTKVELEKVPTARDPWVILQQTPSVIIDRNNVGGNESGQQSVYVSKGAIGAQSTWNIDGVNITDFAATGSSPSYYDFDTFEEMQITTGGTDPRIMTPGTQLNMVTKRGTNDLKGSARGFLTDNSYQSDPNIPAEAQGYLSHVNEINNINDTGIEAGGPIWRDKVWAWGAFGKQHIDILTPTFIGANRAHDKTQLKSENLKLNAQPIASNSLVLADEYNAKIKLGRNVGTTRLPETGWNQNNHYDGGTGSLTDPTLWKIEDTQIIGSNLYLTGLYSKVQGGFQLISDNGKGCQSFACGVDAPVSYRDFAGDRAWHRSYESGVFTRPQTQYRLDGSAFANTGSINHEFKFGFGYRKATVNSQSAWPGDEYTYNYGPGGAANGNSGLVALPRLAVAQYQTKSQDVYAGDTMMFGNLTVQAGLRYDSQKGTTGGGTAAANSVVPDLLPAITVPQAPTLTWTDVSPRLGLTYTLGANKQTLLRAGYSRYIDQMTSGVVNGVAPGGAAYLYYYYNDLNGDNVAQRNEIDFNYGLVSFTGVDPNNPAAPPTALTRWNKGLKAPHTDELILGVEHELLSNLSIGVNGTYRKLNDFIWRIPEKTKGAGDFYTSADYELAPTTQYGILPNGEQVVLPYYQLKAGVPNPKYFVYANRPDYDQTYKGLEITATKRMSNRWMLRGNVTLQDWTQHVGSGAIIDPTIQRVTGSSGSAAGTGGVVGGSACPACDGQDVLYRSTGSGNKGSVYLNSKWAYSLTGVYQIPVIETAFGFNLNGRQGYALPYVWRTSTPQSSKLLVMSTNDIASFRNENVTQLDLRLAKDLRISRLGLTLSIDMFNVLNANTILQRDVGQLNKTYTGVPDKCNPTKTVDGVQGNPANCVSPTSNRVSEVLSPRVFRLGARVTF